MFTVHTRAGRKRAVPLETCTSSTSDRTDSVNLVPSNRRYNNDDVIGTSYVVGPESARGSTAAGKKRQHRLENTFELWTVHDDTYSTSHQEDHVEDGPVQLTVPLENTKFKNQH